MKVTLLPKHLNSADDFEMVPLGRLKQHSRNVNQGDFGAIEESVKANGFWGALVVRRETSEILAGNHRYAVAKSLGYTELPVTWVSCDNDTALRILLADNHTSRLGSNDPSALAELLAELAATDQGLWGTAFSGDDLDQLLSDLAGMPQSGLLADADPDAIPDDAPTRVKPGDLWQLGSHRLLCGDSTKAEDVARLMGGEKAHMVFTDPPYGMGKDFANDDGRWASVLNQALALAGDGWVFAFCSANPSLWRQAWDIVRPDRVLIWHKPFNLGFPYMGFGWHFEPILVCKGEGQPMANLSDLLPCAAILRKDDAESVKHPTQKPVALLQTLLESAVLGDVYDPFLGSGTTIIAAEQTGRKCYGMEIEPKYCSVVLERYERATGKQAVLLEPSAESETV